MKKLIGIMCVICFALMIVSCPNPAGGGISGGNNGGSGNGSDALSLEEFRVLGNFEAVGGVYDLDDLGWVTEGGTDKEVFLSDSTAEQPQAGNQVLKLDKYEEDVQQNTRGFSMQTEKKINIVEDGDYAVRFKYQGEKFANAIRVSLGETELTVPTADWRGESEYWRWNSSGDTNGADSEVYDNFERDSASTVIFTGLSAGEYTFTFAIVGDHVAGEWGFIDGLEIVKTP